MINQMSDQLLIVQTLGDLLEDLEKVRIANTNRIGAVGRRTAGSLPELDIAHVAITALEHQTELQLKRAWRKHPLAPWAASIPGCGEKLIARLIAEIGDPADRENPAKLWAYCGHGDPLRQRNRGMTQEELFKAGNPDAKKRVWLLATQFVKTVGGEGRGARSPYRDLYDEARLRYAERTHERACKRCGPSGKPALPGSPWSDGHKHAAALRYIGKRFLLDLWKEARRLRVYDHIDTQTSLGSEPQI